MADRFYRTAQDQQVLDSGQAVIDAAVAYVESLTAPPIPGVPSRDQPWTQAQARLADAVGKYRLAFDEDNRS